MKEDRLVELAVVTLAALMVTCTVPMLGAAIWAVFAVDWAMVFAIPPVLILVISSLVMVRFVWSDWKEKR